MAARTPDRTVGSWAAVGWVRVAHLPASRSEPRVQVRRAPRLRPAFTPCTLRRMSIETEQDLAGMKAVGAVVRDTLAAMRAAVAPGVTTAELDAVAKRVFDAAGARSAPQLVYRFPGVTCISVNDEIVHG